METQLFAGGAISITIGVLVLLIRLGYLKISIGKKNGNDQEIINLREEVQGLATNHIEHVQRAVDELKESYSNGQRELLQILTRIDTRLQDFINSRK